MPTPQSLAALAAALTALFLTACGGGGDGGAPTYTVACASGDKTSNVSATDYSVCGALPTGSLAVTWASPTGTTGTLSGLPSVTGSTFTQTTLSATPTSGSAVNVVATGQSTQGTSVTLTSASNLASSTQYTLAGTLSVSGYKPTQVSLVFTTPAVSCAAPAQANSLGTCVSPPYGDKSVYNASTGTGDNIWNSVMKAWVARQGLVITSVNQLPADCVNIGDSCWTRSIADGTIKLVDTGMKGPKWNRQTGNVDDATLYPMIFAIYRTPVTGSFPGNWNEKALYADMASPSYSANQGVQNGSSTNERTIWKGTTAGLNINVTGQACFERYMTPDYSGVATRDATTSCN